MIIDENTLKYLKNPQRAIYMELLAISKALGSIEDIKQINTLPGLKKLSDILDNLVKAQKDKPDEIIVELEIT